MLNEKAGCLGKQGHVAEPAPASFFGAVGHQAPEDMSWTHLRGMRLSGWDLENSSPVCRFAMYHRPDTENGTWEISKTWFPLQAWRAPQKRRVVKPAFSMICWVGVRKLCWGHPAQHKKRSSERASRGMIQSMIQKARGKLGVKPPFLLSNLPQVRIQLGCWEGGAAPPNVGAPGLGLLLCPGSMWLSWS